MARTNSSLLTRIAAPFCKFTLALGAALGIASAAKGVEGQDWTGGGSDTLFSTSGNWEGGRASDSTAALRFYFGAGSTVTFDALYPIAEYIWIGNWNNGYVSADGETVTYMTWEAQNSTYGINQTANGITLADNSDQSAALKIESGTYRAGADVSVGSKGGIAYLTMDGGSLEATYWIAAGRDNAATKSYITINNGASLKAGQGTNANGMIDLCGSGTFTVNNGGYVYAPGSKNTGADSGVAMAIANLAGANMVVTNAGGTVELGGSVVVGRNGTGALTLTGGTLKTTAIEGGAGAGTVTLDGGTIVAQADNAAFMPMSANLTVTVGSNGATLNTDGHDITVAQPILGTGTLTLTGGGSVLFTAQPECTIVANGATYTIEDGKFYWTGNGDGVSWSDSGNWSKSAAPGASDDVVFNKAATVTIANTTVNSVAVNAAVTFEGGNTLTVGAGGISGVGTLTLAGVTLNNSTTMTIANDLVIAADTTNILRVGAKNANMFATGSVTGSGRLEVTQWTGDGGNADAGLRTTGDWSDFEGTVEYYQGSNTRSGTRKYQVRAFDTFVPSATSEKASWDVYATHWPDQNLDRSAGHFFATSGTATEPAVYKFGSLQMRLPATKNDSGYASNVMLEVGKLNQNSSLLYSWKSAQNCGVKWVAPSATFSNEAANTAYITLSGGGNVSMTADGVPATLNFKEKGGYVVLTNDDTLNAAIIAAITTVDLDEDGVVGFYYDGDTELSIDVSSKSALLAGNTIAKKGSGTLYVSGAPAETAYGVDVNGGTLVLPHGAVVDDVTVAQGASLVIDLIGAVHNEVVFAYNSISGDATYRNKASIGEIEKDDTAKTWTYKVTGSSRTFTWIGNDGGSWNDANNWLADGQFTTDIPTAIDTVQFSESANISASGTLAGDVQIATGVTLTIPAGLTFSKLTAASGATIAFSSGAIATVGGTLTLITVGEASGVAAALDLPTTYGVSVDSETGAITATRNAGTYIWTGANDSNWATGGNWKVGDIVVADVPAAEDSVVFPTSDAEGFEAWTVALPWDVYADTVTLNANVVLSGARTLKAHTINGTAELRLNNANLGSNGAALDVYCPLNVMPETTNYIYLQKYGNSAGQAYIVNIRGPLYGSGVLTADHAGVQGVGVKFYGDNRNFWGTFTSSNYNSRDCTDMGDYTSSSSNAVWNVYTYNNNSDQAFIVHGTDTYYFGALNGGLQMGSAGGSKSPNQTVSIEVGARDDVASSFALASHVNYNKGYDVSKVGTNKMSIVGKGWAGGNNVFRLNSLAIAGGTAYIPSLPNDFITFGGNGGILQLGYATTSEVVEVTPAELDSETGEVITPAVTETVYTYTPYDPSSLIKNSTAPIGFDDLGTNSTWATALAESNVGGLIKDGAGTLTLSAEPLYLGPTWVKAGKIVFPNGTDVTLDPRTVGTAENADVQGYKYMDNTVLYGNEPGSDVTMNVDVSTITKVDISDPAFAEALVDDGYVVLCATTGNITGLVTRKFVMGETLLVPEKPEDVPAKKWNWMVRIMRINGKNCLCVGPRILPYTITLR